MKLIRLVLAAAITVALVYYLNNPLTIEPSPGQESTLPPLGSFLNPFEGFWQNADGTELDFPEHLDIEGLQAPVEVLYDDRLVPHIFAENEHDLFVAQGYVTAQLRLWQMEFQAYASEGRIAELVGVKGLDHDRDKRRIGMKYGAQRSLEQINSDPQTKEILEAYSKGVNAYIGSLDYKNYPVEYKLMNYTPEEWTVFKTALLLKYMANMLTGHENDIEYTNALNKFSHETFDLLYPLFPDSGHLDPVIPIGTPFKISSPHRDTAQKVRITESAIDIKRQPKPDAQNGSNNWAVAGSKTATGAPILCDDPHLALNLPSIWLEMQLSAPGYNTYGVTIPGSPAIVIGFNEHIAWGVTNASWDVKDWYRVQFRGEAKEEYLFDGKWKETKKVVEEFRVRNSETFYDTIVFTHHGPVVYDESYGVVKEATNLALRWTAHELSNEMKALYLLNKAEDYEGYKTALVNFTTPGQNFVFASVDGDIALWHNGRYPIRDEGEGRLVMNGTTSETEWQGFIPHEEIPHVKNPERGFVSSANQHPTDTTFPYHYTGLYEYYRNRRINQRLSEMENITIEDMKELQRDNLNLIAKESLPLMLGYLDRSAWEDHEQKALDALEKWDYMNEAEFVAPTVFQIWWDSLYLTLWDEFAAAGEALEYPDPYATIKFMSEYPAHELTDITATQKRETLMDVVNISFRKAVNALNEWADENNKSWQWSTFKGTRLAHLARVSAFNVGDLPIGGYKHIVNATSKTHGPSWKMIVSLEEDIQAQGIYPGGQSGNPGSYYYSNFALDWATGKYYNLLFMKNAEEYNSRIIHTLNMGGKDE